VFSNRGNCVDIIAPGVDIVSTWNDGKTNITYVWHFNGAGVVALALAEISFTTVA
jgi:cerevisin